MTSYYFFTEFGYVFALSFSICSLLVLTKEWHLKPNSRRNDNRAVQAAHIVPTPRIGGIGIVAAAILSFFLFNARDSGGVSPIFALSILPVFAAGLLEDLGYHVRPRERLCAAAVSSACAIALLHMWVPRTHVPPIDMLFSLAPLAMVFTVFATAGICNAFNLIDGLNGLASSAAVIAAVGLAAIASRAGHDQLAVNSFLLVAAFFGFLVLNYPFGKIFLGDAGAYSIGHVLSWLAVILMVRAPEVSPWAIVLVFFWPLADTCFAVYRRRRSGKPTGEPDRLHHHQLTMRGIEIIILGRRKRQLANPLATLIMLPMIAAPAVAGSLLWNRPLAAFIALVFFAGAFVGTYKFGLYFVAKRGRPSVRIFMTPKSKRNISVQIKKSDILKINNPR